jgi:hypothetical protein
MKSLPVAPRVFAVTDLRRRRCAATRNLADRSRIDGVMMKALVEPGKHSHRAIAMNCARQEPRMTNFENTSRLPAF